MPQNGIKDNDEGPADRDLVDQHENNEAAAAAAAPAADNDNHNHDQDHHRSHIPRRPSSDSADEEMIVVELDEVPPPPAQPPANNHRDENHLPPRNGEISVEDIWARDLQRAMRRVAVPPLDIPRNDDDDHRPSSSPPPSCFSSDSLIRDYPLSIQELGNIYWKGFASWADLVVRQWVRLQRQRQGLREMDEARWGNFATPQRQIVRTGSPSLSPLADSPSPSPSPLADSPVAAATCSSKSPPRSNENTLVGYSGMKSHGRMQTRRELAERLHRRRQRSPPRTSSQRRLQFLVSPSGSSAGSPGEQHPDLESRAAAPAGPEQPTLDAEASTDEAEAWTDDNPFDLNSRDDHDASPLVVVNPDVELVDLVDNDDDDHDDDDDDDDDDEDLGLFRD